MKKSYPATRAGLRRMSRDLERDIPPIHIPVQAASYPIPPQPPTPSSVIYNGPFVTVSGTGHAVAVGDGAHAELTTSAHPSQLLGRLEDVVAQLHALDLDDGERDEVHDAVDAARRLTAEGDVDRSALARRAHRVLAVLGRVGTATTAGVIAHGLAEPIRALLS